VTTLTEEDEEVKEVEEVALGVEMLSEAIHLFGKLV